MGLGRNGAATPAGRGRQQPGAGRALAAFAALYALNFMDRVLPAALKQPIVQEFHLSDAGSSLPTTGGMFSFMVSSQVAGWLVDAQAVDPRVLLCGAVLLWSVATTMSGLSQGLAELTVVRMLVYAGEGAFPAVACPLIADYFPLGQRTMAYAVMNAGVPVGAALGYAIGGTLGSTVGWRKAFFFTGLPGLALAFTVPYLTLPERGVNDEAEPEPAEAPPARPAADAAGEPASAGMRCLQDYREVFQQPHWFVGMAGTVSAAFGIAVVAEWYPAYMVRYTGISVGGAGRHMALMSLCGAGLGSVAFAQLAEYYSARVPSANFLIPAVFTLPAALLALVGLNTQSVGLSNLSLLAGQFCAFSFMSPVLALMMNVTPPRLRGRSVALQTLFMRTFDMISPPLVGIVSDWSSLRTAMQTVWVALFVADLFWWIGYLRLEKLPCSDPGQALGLAALVRSTSWLRSVSADDTPNAKDETSAISAGFPDADVASYRATA